MKRVRMPGHPMWLVIMVLVTVLLVGPVQGSVWCGQNGIVRLALASGDTVVSVLTAEPGVAERTEVVVYGILQDVQPMSRDSEKFLNIGGFEMRLAVDGAEAKVQPPTFPYAAFNLGRTPAQCRVGIADGVPVFKGPVTLVQWTVNFTEPPQNVVFRLATEGLTSCQTVPGCQESHPFALYTGMPVANQAGDFFGAGYIPAYLNWTKTDEEPDLTPVKGTGTFQDVGIYSEE